MATKPGSCPSTPPDMPTKFIHQAIQKRAKISAANQRQRVFSKRKKQICGRSRLRTPPVKGLVMKEMPIPAPTTAAAAKKLVPRRNSGLTFSSNRSSKRPTNKAIPLPSKIPERCLSKGRKKSAVKSERKIGKPPARGTGYW
ncbi:MAG: hypothetical protein BWY24_00001 [Microgenomates group bacterium ADurb.Bin219]|nr:MAG: hypothetical protein BWY24_00001 [Microgenomates group bacterium ADurb.Bin219]